MHIAIANSMALVSSRDLRFLQDFNGRDLTWLLIGASLALVTMWIVSRQRRRWF